MSVLDTAVAVRPSSSLPAARTRRHTSAPASLRDKARLWIVLGGLLLLGAAAVVTWETVLKDQIVVRRFNVVNAGEIYRSGRLTEGTLTKVHAERGIRTIVDLGGYEPGSDADRTEAEFAQRKGIERHVLRLYGDGTGNPQAYVEALRLMNDPLRHPVLVHCAAGTERTGTAVMLQRIIFEGKSIDEAYAEAEQCGHNPDKNDRMLAYVKRWHEEIALAVRTGVNIADMPAPCTDRADTADHIPGTR